MFSAAVTGVGLGHVPYILSRMPRATAQAHIHAQYRGEYTGPQYERIQPAVYEQRRTTSVPKISSFTSSPRSPCRHLPTAPAGQHRHPRGQHCLWYNFGAHTPKEKKVAFLCGRCIQIGSGREGRTRPAPSAARAAAFSPVQYFYLCLTTGQDEIGDHVAPLDFSG